MILATTVNTSIRIGNTAVADSEFRRPLCFSVFPVFSYFSNCFPIKIKHIVILFTMMSAYVFCKRLFSRKIDAFLFVKGFTAGYIIRIYISGTKTNTQWR